LKVLIVDDEAPARLRLRQLIEDIGEHQVVAEAANGLEALEACQQEQPDVLLLDIRMPGMDGVEAARHLGAMPEPPAIIFTTAYDQYAMDAFDAQAIGYLLKPVRRQRLIRALEQAARLSRNQVTALARQTRAEARTQISARVGDRIRLIPVGNILCFRAEQKYVTVVYPGGELPIDEPLKDLEEEFAESFVRIHRNTLIALEQLEALDRDADGHYSVRMRGVDQPLPVSRRLVSELRKRMRHN
jgi:two-component system response regulator AlgR